MFWKLYFLKDFIRYPESVRNNKLDIRAELEYDGTLVSHIPHARHSQTVRFGNPASHNNYVILKALENKDNVRNFLAIQNLLIKTIIK